jgi:acetyltransferase-like isoleucine patch superfamily enzyme
MGVVDGFLLKVKRHETPFYAALYNFSRSLMRARMPLPGPIKPLYRILYHLHFSVWYAGRWALNFFYREPMFRSRCTRVGEKLHLTLLPDITGHAEIYIGDNVNLYGKVGISSGRVFDRPRLVIEDGVDIGHIVLISVNKEIIIEKGVHIASNVRIVDNDGHPRDPALRAADAPPPPDEVKPVRIGRYAWIGHGCYIMKGVTIGEGAIIGAASVVVTDIPAYSVAMGNPARVVVKDIRKQPAPQPPVTAPQSSSS